MLVVGDGGNLLFFLREEVQGLGIRAWQAHVGGYEPVSRSSGFWRPFWLPVRIFGGRILTVSGFSRGFSPRICPEILEKCTIVRISRPEGTEIMSGQNFSPNKTGTLTVTCDVLWPPVLNVSTLIHVTWST